MRFLQKKTHYQSVSGGNYRQWEINVFSNGQEATSRRGSREHTTPEEACPNRGPLHSQQSKLGEEDSTTTSKVSELVGFMFELREPADQAIDKQTHTASSSSSNEYLCISCCMGSCVTQDMLAQF